MSAVPNQPSAVALTTPFHSRSTELPPPEHPLGYTVAQVAGIIGRSRVTAIEHVRRFHQRGGAVYDLTAHLPQPKKRARKYSPVVAPESMPNLLAQLQVPPPAPAPKQLHHKQVKQAERVKRERSAETRKRDKEKLAALRAGVAA